MGLSHKSHGKKSDKECQSPMLKIFKDIMQKENTDPEKIKLLKDKQREKRRRVYSESRSKSDQRTYDSSSTDRYKSNKPTKITVQDIQEDRNENYNERPRSEAFQGEKKDSWWFWGENEKNEKKKEKQEDTCSCVSCALKKIVGSEYTCVACLSLLFSVSVVVAFMLIFKTMPVTDPPSTTCDDNLVNKMRMLKEKRQLSEEYLGDYSKRNKWQDSLINRLGSYSGVLGSEYTGNSFKDSNLIEDFDSGVSGDLASVLGNDKIAEGQNSDRLKEFFKKLIQTDAQIRKLKQAIKRNYNQDDNEKILADRYKRSLKKKPKFYHFYYYTTDKINYKSNVNKVNASVGKKSHKMYKKGNGSEITGYVIEEEKLFVKYEPERKRNFPKCSHVHKTKSHEKKLKHPYYKHSQRLDEMLDAYKNPEVKTKEFDDTFILDKNRHDDKKIKDNSKFPKKHSKVPSYKVYEDSTVNIFPTDSQNIVRETSDNYKIDDYLKDFSTTTPRYGTSGSGVLPFLSTIGNTASKISELIVSPGYRKLLQVEEEDQEDLSYEDLKEVLTDDKQGHDDLDRETERKKRNEQEQKIYDNNMSPNKLNPPGMYNPNWKGPMPLYPDELNAMIRQAALQNLVNVPINTKDTKMEKDKAEPRDVSDTQYIEDYSDDKYDKMVNMAQAYSDYGVLYGTKDNIIENDKNAEGTKQKFRPSRKGFFMKRFFSRPKKGGDSEGIRIEFKSGHSNNGKEFLSSFRKNLQISSDSPKKTYTTAVDKLVHEYNRVYTASPISFTLETEPTKSPSEKAIAFAIKKGSRSLKSVDLLNDTQDDIVQNTDEHKETMTNKIIKNLGNSITDNVIRILSSISNWFQVLTSTSKPNKSHKNKKNTNNENDTKFLLEFDKNQDIEESNIREWLQIFNISQSVNDTSRKNRALLAVNEVSANGGIIPVALVLAANNTSSSNKVEREENSTKKNKTIVKRSLNNKQVSWNDLYDDEYGVKIDYLDNVRNKHSAKDEASTFKRSKEWIKGKWRNMNKRLKCKNKKIKTTITMKTTNQTLKKILKTTTSQHKSNKPPKTRKTRNSDNEDADVDVKRNFATLTANMKKVCQEAARAVQNTRNIEVREDTKEGATATSLMQQLVRLMTDLVDIQVQQKTCAKLPSDLINFLEWLTAPDETNPQVDELRPGLPDYVQAADDDSIRFGKSTESNLNYLPAITEDTHQDDRTECLGTIRAVQDLIQQYEGMNDEDKSKMTGVKEYLENQLLFLNNKLGLIDANSIYKKYDKRDTVRIRRDVERNNCKQTETKNSKERKKTVQNFIEKRNVLMTNSYGKRDATNTKSENFERVNVIRKRSDNSELYEENWKDKAVSANSKDNKSFKQENDLNKDTKRNVKDVYYKAIEEAKKFAENYTTIINLLEKRN